MLLMKLMIIACVIGMLRTSERFQSMSRELDASAMSALRRAMDAAEESGFPSVALPMLMLLSALIFMYAMVTTPGGR